jgi:predicted GTPase
MNYFTFIQAFSLFSFVDITLSSTNQQQVLTTTEALSNDNDINSEVHILICGGPKVGKSTLINAFCGCPVAKTSTIGLDECTKRITSYQLDNIYFWDTPGIQQWSQLDIDSYFNSSTQRQKPLCMFYCASPGSFTKLKQLDMLLDECIHRRHIFCVLVVTNMYTNVNRHAVLEEFKTLLSKYVESSHQIREEHGVWYYGQVGLCTMVNSQEYVIEATNRQQPQQGINELVLALTKSLSGIHHLSGWLRTIEKNRQFWFDNQEELYKLTENSDNLCLSEML